MHIGLTYDLRSEYRAAGYPEEQIAEFDSEETIAALAEALRRLGHKVDLVGSLPALATALVAGRRWDLVFNIAEGLWGFGREAAVPALLDAYQVPYTFSDPLVMALTLHKGHTKAVVAAAGIPTAAWAVVSDADQAPAAAVRLGHPVFVKPVAEGTGKGISSTSRVNDLTELRTEVTRLLEEFRQPVLVEPYLPGREFTVGLLGTAADACVLGTLEIVLRDGAEAGAYTYANKEHCERLVEYRPVSAATDPTVEQAELIALAAWRALGCRDAGRVDLRCDEQNRPQFMEVNPLAGLHPTHSDLPMIATAVGLGYDGLLAAIVDSACARIDSRPTARRRSNP